MNWNTDLKILIIEIFHTTEFVGKSLYKSKLVLVYFDVYKRLTHFDVSDLRGSMNSPNMKQRLTKYGIYAASPENVSTIVRFS